MNKTINISLAGQLFKIDDQAFAVLKNYLDHVKANVFPNTEDDETINDIEVRIAEIFGGGQELPSLVSLEMVNKMIEIMGAPEDFYDDMVSPTPSDEDNNGISQPIHKPKRSNNSWNTTSRKNVSSFFSAIRLFFMGIARLFGVVFGIFFIIIGVCSISALVGGVTLANTGLITPTIQNPDLLISLVLGNIDIEAFNILGAMVVIIPLLDLTIIGISMVLNRAVVSKEAQLTFFIVWLIACFSLIIMLSKPLSDYRQEYKSVDLIKMETPVDTLYINTRQRISTDNYQYAGFDKFKVWKDEEKDKLYCNVGLDINGGVEQRDIMITKSVRRNTSTNLWKDANALSYEVYFSGDTLYMDEFFVQEGSERWKWSTVTIDVRLKEGTIIKPVNESAFSIIDLKDTQDADYYEVRSYGLLRKWY